MSRNHPFIKTPFSVALGLCFGIGAAQAQSTTPLPAADSSDTTTAATTDAAGGEMTEIVITGIRKALTNATDAKRDATAFTDSIFAEDIGKLPSTNIAETLNRIPGVQLNRDISGEGTQVAVRGLGPSFTTVLMNNTPIAVASDGGIDGGNGNREVDLDLFPTELFTRLDVSKTPVASQLEGGIAGTVNMRNARPFDNPGQHLTYVLQGSYAEISEKTSPRFALIGSKTWGDFGVLAGVAVAHNQFRTDGFESLGWNDGCLTASPDDCGSGNNNFRYAVTAPNNVDGLTAGSTLDLEALSGLSSDQLDNALIPRLGRYAYAQGTRDRVSGVVSMQYQPSDDLQANLDLFYATAKRDFRRVTSDWSVRNSSPSTMGGMVPMDLTVDENNVVTHGTFANSRFFIEARPINDDVDFYNINPSFKWRLADELVMNAQLNYGHSTFDREAPSFLFDTPAESGLVVDYSNDGTEIPIITPNVDLADPNLGWVWDRVNIQNVRRVAETWGGQFDFTFGEKDENLKFGTAYSDTDRDTKAYDNSTNYQAHVCGATCGENDGDGAVENDELSQYLHADNNHFSRTLPGPMGYDNWVVPDFKALKAATDYDDYNKGAPLSLTSSQGTPTGYFREKTFGAYTEVNKHATILDHDTSFNAGIRYIHTDQLVQGPANVAGEIQFFSEDTTYEEFLPSFNATFNATDNLKLRMSGSRTMTRANPSNLLPGVTFSDPSAQSASKGNPELTPYTSNNVDLGGEFYTGGEGYVGLSLFNKDVNGFTTTEQSDVPFTDLGISYDSLTATQQAALEDRGGADVATVTLSQPVNVDQTLTLRGTEITWVQPLDIVLNGLGFQANYTHISQKSAGDASVTGISPNTYNMTGYWEDEAWSVRVTYFHADGGISQAAPQNSLPLAMRYGAQNRVDMSVSYLLPYFNHQQRLTLDAFNLTDETQRSTIGYSNMPYNDFAPGYSLMLGLHGSF